MDYTQAREFIEETGKYGIVCGLDSIKSLMARLGNVQERLCIIHVAGTNGKGSVCAMLSNILLAAGYRTGVYTSPAVFEPEEIMKVNGRAVTQEEFAALAGRVQAACRDMQKEGLPHPTAFEVETAIAFCFFWQEACEYVVLETGLGGEQDATNLITHPVCSVFASISKDHMAFLGNTLQEIAAAKAGILKPGCPCVSAAQKPEVLEVLKQAAAQKQSAFYTADPASLRRFSYDGRQSFFEADWYPAAPAPGGEQAGVRQEAIAGTLGLVGACQRQNLACVLETVRLLRGRGVLISREAVLEGLAHVRLPGRMERIAGAPDFYIDGAHNEGAAYCLRETIMHCLAGRRIVYIIGVFADKEYEKALQALLPYAAQVFTVTPRHPRALDGRILAQKVQHMQAMAAYMPDVGKAAAAAQAAAGTDGVVLAFGSFSYLKELKAAVQGRVF
ncbi:MAG: bifunctional folylpolyglutamate synthase/dihydrofolate synthase [Eubacterium sp.]|nr:bifunctional folylpolyglutamate synthase/dihydrofolate synthase [Eubacterium sp.]